MYEQAHAAPPEENNLELGDDQSQSDGCALGRKHTICNGSDGHNTGSRNQLDSRGAAGAKAQNDSSARQHGAQQGADNRSDVVEVVEVPSLPSEGHRV